jgi:acyl-CoA thioesterase-2
MPSVPPPESVPSLQAFVRERSAELDASAIRNFSGDLPVEMRVIDPEAYFLMRPERRVRDFWFRLPSASAVDEPRLQQCLLAYASDYWLAGVAAVGHTFPTNGRSLLMSSLDHAIWFHRPVRCEEWLLYHTASPSAEDGLGLARGFIFDRAGKLAATVTQQCLMRRLSPKGN